MLEIRGNKKEIDELVAFEKSDKHIFDLEKITPIPEKEKREDDWFENNWGTIHNISDGFVSREEEGFTVFNFDTAWSPASPIVEKLSRMFPNLLFTHKFEEGGFDYSGIETYKAGEKIDKKSGYFDDYPVGERENIDDEKDINE